MPSGEGGVGGVVTPNTPEFEEEKKTDLGSGPTTPGATPTASSTYVKTAEDALKTVTSQASPTPVKTDVEKQQVGSGEIISGDSGQLASTGVDVKTTTGQATTAGGVEEIDPSLVEAAKSAPKVNATLEDVKAWVGKLSPAALASIKKINPEKLAQLGLDAAQIKEAVQIVAPDDRTVQKGEIISGSAVDTKAADAVADKTAQSYATADPTKKATVQGQLEGLMTQFEGGKTPAWAAGAIRAANDAMAARGLSSSSLAGQAILQAAMESAVPIAQADAQTYATFELQNLSNKQQATILAAEQRAQFLGQKFDQDFQTKVLNAATITEIANKNYDASVQIALENARLAQSVDLANLDAKNAKILSDAAAMTQIQSQNLSNAQQAALQNAQSFLQMDLSNADRQQQTQLFKAQERVNAIMSDTAQENAARQFNATSENQTKQFMASLQSQIEQFNAGQKNAMTQFNVSEKNAMAQFKSEQKSQREQFNAANRLVVDQANAAWRQQVSTNNTQAINEANALDAQNATTLSVAEYNNLAQARRDAMSYILTATESEKDRALELVLGQMEAEAAMTLAKYQSAASRKNSLWETIGGVAGNVLGNIFDKG